MKSLAGNVIYDTQGTGGVSNHIGRLNFELLRRLLSSSNLAFRHTLSARLPSDLWWQACNHTLA